MFLLALSIYSCHTGGIWRHCSSDRVWQGRGDLLRHLWGAGHSPSHPHHRQQLCRLYKNERRRQQLAEKKLALERARRKGVITPFPGRPTSDDDDDEDCGGGGASSSPGPAHGGEEGGSGSSAGAGSRLNAGPAFTDMRRHSFVSNQSGDNKGRAVATAASRQRLDITELDAGKAQWSDCRLLL